MASMSEQFVDWRKWRRFGKRHHPTLIIIHLFFCYQSHHFFLYSSARLNLRYHLPLQISCCILSETKTKIICSDFFIISLFNKFFLLSHRSTPSVTLFFVFSSFFLKKINIYTKNMFTFNRNIVSLHCWQNRV